MKPVAPVTNTFIDRSFAANWRNPGTVKRPSDELFTFLPESFCRVGVERVGPHAFACARDGHVIRRDLADMAVFAIAPADFVCGRNDTGPYRFCGSLRNGLSLETPLPS